MTRFVLTKPEGSVGYSYVNAKGNAECVEFVRKTTCAPATQFWRAGLRVAGNEEKIVKGTAIATFIDGAYPSASTGNHAAIFLDKTHDGIRVLDQWRTKPSVSERVIRFKKTEDVQKEIAAGRYKRSNDANCYYVIDVVDGIGAQCE